LGNHFVRLKKIFYLKTYKRFNC